MFFILIASALLPIHASPFVDLRAINIVDVILGIWRRHTIPRVPDTAPPAVSAGAPPAGTGAGVGAGAGREDAAPPCGNRDGFNPMRRRNQ